MSAPDTNIDKQKKRHKPSLFGIGGAAVFGVVLLIAFITWTTMQGQEPQGADVQVDGRTGELEAVQEPVSN